jgi:hypothetical protein
MGTTPEEHFAGFVPANAAKELAAHIVRHSSTRTKSLQELKENAAEVFEKLMKFFATLSPEERALTIATDVTYEVQPEILDTAAKVLDKEELKNFLSVGAKPQIKLSPVTFVASVGEALQAIAPKEEEVEEDAPNGSKKVKKTTVVEETTVRA